MVGTGRLYHKSVSALDDRNGRRYGFDVLTLLYADSSERVIGDLVAEFADAYEPPATLRIGPALHDRLTDEFEVLAYDWLDVDACNRVVVTDREPGASLIAEQPGVPGTATAS